MTLSATSLKPFLTNSSNVTVVYHAGCNDGFCGALIFWYLFGDKATYLPFRHDTPFNLSIFAGRSVLLVDFSFPRVKLLALKDVAENLLVLDHHKTSKDELEDLPFCHFDLNRSGAMIAFELARPLLPAVVPTTKLQMVVAYIQDRDLWRWGLKNSKAINTALWLWPRNDFKAWDNRFKVLPSEEFYEQLVDQGNLLVKQEEVLVKTIAANAKERTFEGLPTLEVNTSCLWSEVGGYLLGRESNIAVALLWSEQKNGTYRYELRARDPAVNVGALAKRYGGGGHPSAAGFVVPNRI